MEKNRLITKSTIWYGGHREDGPASILFNGAIAFRLHNKLLFSINPDGAMVFWDQNGLVILRHGQAVKGKDGSSND